jgi:hypothetical protein
MDEIGNIALPVPCRPKQRVVGEMREIEEWRVGWDGMI